MHLSRHTTSPISMLHAPLTLARIISCMIATHKYVFHAVQQTSATPRRQARSRVCARAACEGGRVLVVHCTHYLVRVTFARCVCVCLTLTWPREAMLQDLA